MDVAAPPETRARTAIAAGVLAVLGGLWFLTGIVWVSLVLGFGQHDLLVPGQLTDAVIGLLLLLGGTSLLARVEAGRILCLAAAVLALAATIVDMVLRYQLVFFIVGGPTGLGEPGLRMVVIAVPFVALLVLAALPATRRWTRL
ncbi:hypothetical protein SAMN04489727_8542 [Amycolatopsis tolypomycina]|uniref:Uncharacterized protein n=1 Tax=Amycolatopsis tolypomycina TaxID=208445 RepID=A0A1H5C0H6_9PSEU|nr:hypothetical protein [Amycolatopsis tolypomycina]SED60313.1 hypothetical protein SAMN04489727_8542 [Amycolatopsis tolypomycina]